MANGPLGPPVMMIGDGDGGGLVVVVVGGRWWSLMEHHNGVPRIGVVRWVNFGLAMGAV